MNKILSALNSANLGQKRSRNGVIAMSLLSLISLYKFGLGARSDAKTTFGFTLNHEWVIIKELVINSSNGSLIFSLLAIAGTIFAFVNYLKARTLAIPSALVAIGVLMSFITWVASGKFIPITGLLQGALLLAIPLIFGSMSGLLCERSGVINIAIEGQLLASAFVSGVIASLTHQAGLGLLVAPMAGATISLILATFSIKFGVDQVILGFVINVLVIGLTNFLYKKLLIPYQSTWNTGPTFSRMEIPLLGKIPILGPIFFDQTIIVYLMYAIVATISFALYRTKWGLRTRSVGEHPTAADSVGINVNKLRFRNVILAGLVAGIGGAYFTVGSVGSFSKEMTAGSGFIALAALIFGKWSPKGAIAAALLFGFADNLQSTLTIIGVSIPSEFMLMVPYVATIIAVTGLVGRVRAPAADGVPYRRGVH